MEGYWALVHKQEDTAFGVSFPDVPGCISAGGTLEEALAQGREALSSHLAWMRAEGDPVPPPRTYEALCADPEVAEIAEGATWHLLMPRGVRAPRVRINVMIDPFLLRETDETAEALGMTRSGFIERALHESRAFRQALKIRPLEGSLAELQRLSAEEEELARKSG